MKYLDEVKKKSCSSGFELEISVKTHALLYH